MAQYQLVMKQGPAPGKTFEFTKNEIHIGRDINNEIVINDAEVSRRHCRFKLKGESYTLEDLGSTNGTFVNEQRLSGAHTLRAGEMIRLGDTVILAFEMTGADADATIASAGAPPPPRQQPKPQPAAPPQPQYAGQVPASPAQEAEPPGNRRTIMIGCGALLIVGVCVTIAFLFWVDSTKAWCEWFGFILGDRCL